jgi:hypothetical protein
MRAITRVVAAALMTCGLWANAPVSQAATDGILNGTYDVVGPNSTMDRWVISTNCTTLAKGCVANIGSSWVAGEAQYKGFYTWVLTFKGIVPICPDKSSTKGMMAFQWNSQTLQGQLTSMQRGPCQMTRPGDSQTAFTLVPVQS